MNTIIFESADSRLGRKIFCAGLILGVALFAFAGEVFAVPVLAVTPTETNQITETSATLVGYVENAYKTSLVWFEWSESFAMSTLTVVGMTNVFDKGFFKSTVSNLKPDTTYYYRAVSSEGGTTVYSSIISFRTKGGVVATTPGTVITQGTTYPAYTTYPTYPTYTTWSSLPTVTTNSPSSVSQASATLNGYVYPNNSSTDAWFEWGTTPSFGNNTGSVNYGMNSTSYNSMLWNLSYNTSYYYRAVARNSYGMVYGSTLSFTVPPAGTATTTGTTGSLPEATTLFATELTGTEAKLNGLVSTSADQPSSAWFEWGTSASLGSTTQSLNIGILPVAKHSDSISGLVFGETYYYRVVAENPYGKVYGTIMSFVSDGTPVVQSTTVISGEIEPKTPVAKPTVTVIGRGSAEQSLVTLTIDGGAEAISVGEKRSYHVVWKNKDKNALKNVVLRVTFPQVMNIESATKGSFSSAENAVTVDIKTLAPEEEGEAFIFATAGRGLKIGGVIVVTANMVYTDASGVQGDAIAYVTHRGEVAVSALSANIFDSGSFIPTTLFGWILLIILVLALVLLGNHLYGKFAETKSH